MSGFYCMSEIIFVLPLLGGDRPEGFLELVLLF